MEGAGRVDSRRHREQYGHRLRPELRGAEIDQRADTADQQANRWKIAR